MHLVRSREDASAFVQRTLWAHQLRVANAHADTLIESAAGNALKFLITHTFLRPLQNPPADAMADGSEVAAPAERRKLRRVTGMGRLLSAARDNQGMS